MSKTSINDFLKQTASLLAASGADSPALDARLLLRHALKMTEEELFLNSASSIEDSQLKLLNTMIARRLLHEPVSRIIGKRAFWKHEFKITSQTLDPRADSETLIEAALKYQTTSPQRILDLGTGTGCLLLSLLHEWPQAKGIGLDISPGAVAVAKENAQNIQLEKRCSFKEIDWNLYNPDEKFDVLVSNPPYIAEEEREALDLEVSQYDPAQALFSGADGLDSYRSIIKRLENFLHPKSMIFLEIGHKQAASVKTLLAADNIPVLHTVTDLAGRDRVIVAQMP